MNGVGKNVLPIDILVLADITVPVDDAFLSILVPGFLGSLLTSLIQNVSQAYLLKYRHIITSLFHAGQFTCISNHHLVTV